ncbi:hypothetical protein AQUCO_00201147v1 [Aquilegia coerulea]|uniref:Uncharacterized protein n=1 Tax=Aquilegia coerulea TaxID=218851 RepID=A0A2G5F6Q4_AQUCA|nr:hypothetical protein AQUCO_00201147v1 [Aquilegia coerulea]
MPKTKTTRSNGYYLLLMFINNICYVPHFSYPSIYNQQKKKIGTRKRGKNKGYWPNENSTKHLYQRKK